MNDSFCAFILTFNRPNNQLTYRTLKNLDFKYPIYFIVSDDDPSLEEYKKLYGDKVLEFNKENAVIETKTDLMDNFRNKKAIIYARNYSFLLARRIGVRYFLQLDDDYYAFNISNFKMRKWFLFSKNKKEGFNECIESCLEFYKNNPRILGFSLSQGGDFVGGIDRGKMKVKRKCMNSFFFDVERSILFKGTLNEDVNFYTGSGARDGICLQNHIFKVTQNSTQKSCGGMTDSYLESGTYIKSFYSIMTNPSAVRIDAMGDVNYRIHHRVDYNKVAPKIIREIYKKK